MLPKRHMSVRQRHTRHVGGAGDRDKQLAATGYMVLIMVNNNRAATLLHHPRTSVRYMKGSNLDDWNRHVLQVRWERS